MGEIADAMVNGYFCEWCGEVIDMDEPGFARLCPSCERERRKEAGAKKGAKMPHHHADGAPKNQNRHDRRSGGRP